MVKETGAVVFFNTDFPLHVKNSLWWGEKGMTSNMNHYFTSTSYYQGDAQMSATAQQLTHLTDEK
jgi:hypothetical protein